MPRKKSTVLNKQARSMVYDVYCYMKKEAEESGVGKTAMEIYKRTAEATDTSVATVRRIIREGSDSEAFGVFVTPGKKRPRNHPVTGLDSINQGVVKRCIHNFHLTNQEMPTIGKLRKKLQEVINFQGSEVSLRRILKRVGFKWMKTENTRKVLIEKSSIRFKRIEFLEKIKKYREEGRPIIYTDESYVDSIQSCASGRSDESTEGFKKPASIGQRVVMVHAGTGTGFVPNALLTFKADTKSENNHDIINYNVYEKWLRTQLIPNLPPKSVVIVGNAPYHNKQYHPAPSSNAKKSDMMAWLVEKGIHHNGNESKPQLYNLIKAHKKQYKKFNIDHILAENEHSVLRLPPFHPDLNPMEMALAVIKGYVSSKNLTFNINQVTELIKEKLDLMGARDWDTICGKVRNIEEEYRENDHVIDRMTEELVLRVDDDNSDESNYDSEASEDDYYEDEEPITSTNLAAAGLATAEDYLPRPTFILGV